MYFKAIFEEGIVDESFFDNLEIENSFNQVLSKEIILYKKHEFEVERTNEGEIVGLSFASQCTITQNIEPVFIELISTVIYEDSVVKLVDSIGLIESVTKDELLDMI